jgi:hypothetical protein
VASRLNWRGGWGHLQVEGGVHAGAVEDGLATVEARRGPVGTYFAGIIPGGGGANAMCPAIE